MTYIITSETELEKAAPPNLPLAPAVYDSRYQEQLNNVLRLFFNRLNNLFGQLDSSTLIPPTTVYTVATLPSAVTSGAGARTFVSNATATTFASIVAGGGANQVPVYSDGTNWRIG